MRLTEIKIAARKSDLARLQAYLVGDALLAVQPDLKITYQFRESLGDKNLNDPLWKMPEKGVFTEDFYQDLLDGRTDLVVHSWKDLPNEAKPKTKIAATLPRADVRDLLLFKKSSLEKLKTHSSLQIFSSSPRRAYNLIPFLSGFLPFGEQHLEFLPVRGNVQTRVRKMLDTVEVDGLIVAKAALDRLLSATRPEFAETRTFLKQSLEKCQWMVLPLTANPAAAAQGALAIETLANLEHRPELAHLLSSINDPITFETVQAERKRLAQYGGGCHQKIGVTHLRRSFGEIEFLRGLTDQGEVLNSQSALSGQPPSGLTVVGSESAFSKEKITHKIPANFNAFFVSHADAWQDDFQASVQTPVLWTAGLATWKALAALGHWVHGSSESLGEQESPRLAELATDLTWAKLGHEGSSKSSHLPLIATYRLVPKTMTGNLELNGENFYWKSASSFRSALEKQPNLVQKKHYCGPGNSYEEIRQFFPQIEILWPSPKQK